MTEYENAVQEAFYDELQKLGYLHLEKTAAPITSWFRTAKTLASKFLPKFGSKLKRYGRYGMYGGLVGGGALLYGGLTQNPAEDPEALSSGRQMLRLQPY